jgi:hypothetical protein
VRRLNPLTGLRPRIAALVLGGVLVAATLIDLIRDGVLLTDRTSARSRPA